MKSDKMMNRHQWEVSAVSKDYNDTNIFKCKRCHATFIGQEFDEHLCTPAL
jgi:hypothetical protein